jgi:hypothetical protein
MNIDDILVENEKLKIEDLHLLTFQTPILRHNK